MEKEKVLEIEITKLNNEYSLAKVNKINSRVIKEKEKYSFGYANSSSLKMNSELHEDPNFHTYISDTILCSDLYLNSENDCFTIKNNIIESLELFLQEFNEKYGVPKRWRGERSDKYFSIFGDSEISEITDNYFPEDQMRYEWGNYFKTKEEAEKVKEELDKFWAKVRAGEIGDELGEVGE